MSILTKHEAADVPHIPDDRLGLNQLLDDRPDDDQQVVRADHHIPDNKSIKQFYDWHDIIKDSTDDKKIGKG